MSLKLKKMTEEEINQLPYPETAKALGGVIYIEDEVDENLVNALKQAWDNMNKDIKEYKRSVNMQEIKPVAKSFTKYLSEKYGGKWKYHRRSGEWTCNDGIRYVREVHIGGYDTDEGWAGPATRYLYYKDGRPTEIV